MDQTMEQSHSTPSNYLIGDTHSISNPELTWQPHLSAASTSQPLLPHYSLPMWHASSYEDLPMPSTEYYVQPFTDDLASSFLQSSVQTNSIRRSVTGFKPSESEVGTTSSDSDGDDLDYEEGSSSYSGRKGPYGSNHTDGHAISDLKHGRWSIVNDPFSLLPYRHYICGRIEYSGSIERHCDRGFQRYEHLRRHIKTVHGNERNYPCKVPQCRKAFTRGDNLKDHYWTHIQRGGRAGKNEKMNLAELKTILGPKEKKLLRKLKQRLSEHQAKLRSKS
jgi:hypothetical protein